MAAKIIDGQGPAEEIKQDLAHEVEQLIAAGTAPHLVAVQVGENPASKIYTNMQAKACESVGIEYELRTLPAEATEADLLDLLARANSDQAVTGIILQMPLPSHFDARAMQMALAVEKDVEGMHPENLGKLFYGGGAVGPCTAMSAVELLQRTVGGKAKLAGLEVVIVGHSEVFGKPAAVMLLDSFDFSPTVTICHVATKDLAFPTSRADVVIVPTGARQIRWQG